LRRASSVDVQVQQRLVERLVDAQIGHARHLASFSASAEAKRRFASSSATTARRSAGQTEVQNLRDDVGRNERRENPGTRAQGAAQSCT